jgi:sarcosine oxidase
MPEYDVLVVGLGAMGSAAAWQLARRGLRVLGVDRFVPPHSLGSSHGRSRMIREAYFEHPLYVPLVQRAYQAWAALEAASGSRLLTITGGLMIGLPNGGLVAGARQSALGHGLPFEELSGNETRQRFPAFQLAPGEVALREPRAGVLDPEACITVALNQAGGLGAELHYGETVRGWEPTGRGVRVETDRGNYGATRLVLAAGAWMAGSLPKITQGLTVERQVMFWLSPAAHPEHFTPTGFPVFIWEWTAGRYLYGFPDFGTGVKVARHHEGEAAAPDDGRRPVDAGEEAEFRRLLAERLPDANGRLLETAVCLYTNAPDGHFVLDFHPECPEVIVASPCSGHGFKFASAIGGIVADLVLEGSTSFDLTPFRIRR